MPVQPDSRYANLPLLAVTAPDGSQRNVIELRLQSQVTNVATTAYRIRDRDVIDFLARRFYGDEHLWWQILDANPTVYPLDIKAGDVLEIPAPGGATAITRARRF
jgi:phage tail protein X